jgi:LCP family protein required for cell wall assembly
LSTNPPAGDRPPQSPSRATLLSFLWPGLGQLYEGRRRRALVFAVPALIVAIVFVGQALRGLDVLAIELIIPTVALTVLVVVVLLGAWRLVSMADAMLSAGTPGAWRRGSARAVLIGLSAIVLLTHGAAAYYAYSFYDAGSSIFVANKEPDPTPAPGASATPEPSDNSIDFQGGPVVSPPPSASSRINILFTGVDSGTGRDHALTDTMLIASIDPTTKAVVLISFPRDISNFKLWDGRTYHGKLNSLMTTARLYPKAYPDGAIGTLTKELGFLLGVPIYYYAAINLDGFKEMVDLVGGVDITYDKDIFDPSYIWEDGSPNGFYLKAGTHHLNGRHALAFVRSRKADSDFARAARQQILLIALRKELTKPAMLPRIPALLKAAKQAVRTDFPQSQAADMVSLVRAVNDKSIQRYVLGPPYSIHPPNNTTNGIYTLRLDMGLLAKLSVKLFGADSAYYVPPAVAPSGAPAP